MNKPKKSKKSQRSPGFKAGLNREKIAEVTLQTIAKDGLDGLSTRIVAKHLGVQPMALYNHFSSKRALLEGAFSALIAKIPLPKVDMEPKAALMKIAKDSRAVALSYPQAIPLFALVCP